MRILKFLIIATVVVAALVVGIGLALPDTVHLERSTVVKARPATVYTALNGFKQFNKWSPWAQIDPKTQYVHAGPLWGVGAKLSWSSDNPSVGHGSQEIVEAVPYRKIRSRLVFDGFD
ncbi:MAG: SRPBCC family protein, partial [Solimonas sp.]